VRRRSLWGLYRAEVAPRFGQFNEQNLRVKARHPMLPKDAGAELGSGMLALVPAWKLTERSESRRYARCKGNGNRRKNASGS
jgi:hypothetical protein